MQRWKNIVWLSAALVALGFVLTELAPPVIAQIRAALVRDMDSPIRGTRYIERINDVFDAGQFSASGILTPIVPAGKRLFLQRVSIETILSNNQAPQNAKLSLSQASSSSDIKISQSFQGGATQQHYIGNQDLDILLNAGESITVSVFRNDNLGTSSLNFFSATVIGYFVDLNP